MRTGAVQDDFRLGGYIHEQPVVADMTFSESCPLAMQLVRPEACGERPASTQRLDYGI